MMTDARQSINSLLKEANKNMLYFVLIFIFVYFAIVLPAKYPDTNGQKIQANKAIAGHLSTLQTRIDALTKELQSIPKEEAPARKSEVQTLEKEIAALTENKIKYLAELASSPKDERVSIPLISVSVNQAVILTAYPAFLLLGVCLALRYRYRLLSIVPDMNDEEKNRFKYPVWAFPVPSKYAFENVVRWSASNALGGIAHFLLLFFAYDYGLGVDKSWVGKGQQNPEVFFFNILASAITLGFYVVTVYDLIRKEWQPAPI